MKWYGLITLFISSLSIAYSQNNDTLNTSSQIVGDITGIVRSAATQKPLPGVTVRVSGTNYGAISRTDGKFSIRNVPTGVWAIEFTGIGLEKYIQPNVTLSTGKPVTLEIEMIDKIVELQGVEVRSSFFQKSIDAATSTQSFNAQEIRRAPGVQEDVIRATSLLPGVGVTQAGRNDLVVRGGAPFENLFIVDNIEVPNINHFGSQGASGGPLSLINIDLVDNVDFSTGGFGSQYGDKVSSITNIKLRNGNDQKLAGELNLSATGFGAIFEGPICENVTFLFSARRSYLDLIFKAAGFGFIPQYWDFQGKLAYKIDNANTIEFLTIAALNDVTLNNDSLDNRYDNSRVAIPNQQQYFSGLSWRTLFDKGFATFTLGRTFTDFNTFQNDSLLNPVFKNKSAEGEMSFKSDFDFQLSPKLQLTFGNQLKYASKLDYDVIIQGYLRTDENGNPQALQVDTSFTALRNGTYGNLTMTIGPQKLTFGGRLDYYGFLESKFVVSPRLSTVYQINPVSAVIFSAGRYYQPPSFVWLIGAPGQNLKPIRSDMIVAGYQHTPLEDVKVQIEGYYKWYGNYPARVYRPQAVLSPSGFDDITTDIPFGLEPITSTGEGISRGFEIFVQKKLSDIPLYGLMSFSFSETKFTSIDGVSRTGAFDTRFIFNLSAGYMIGTDWEISGRFRIADGLPTTPFKDDNSGKFDYSRYNEGDRFPLFHQFDFRIDKRWNFSSFSLITYIDIQNLYSRKNVSGVKWNFRTQSPEYQESFGILPSIGVTFEF